MGWDTHIDTCSAYCATQAHIHGYTYTQTCYPYLLYMCAQVQISPYTFMETQAYTALFLYLLHIYMCTHAQTILMYMCAHEHRFSLCLLHKWRKKGKRDFCEPPLEFLILICHPKHSALPVAKFSFPWKTSPSEKSFFLTGCQTHFWFSHRLT